MKVVITGAARGIGLEICHQALVSGHEVCAVARDPGGSAGLQKLFSEFKGKLHLVKTDVTDAKAGEQILKTIQGWPSVDVLINNAGILDQEMTAEALIRSYQVNSIAPLLITTALLPKLKASTQPVVVQITSRMGSISEVSSGGFYAYRSSKAALNMINKCLSMDHSWLSTFVVHPGWVKTDMGGASALVEPKDSAAGIWKLINNAGKQGKAYTGKFFDFTGSEIPW